MLGRTDRRIRLVALLLVFVVIGLGALVRLSEWQIARSPDLRAMAERQLVRATEEAPLRGRILDRTGVVLATNTFVDRLAAHPDLLSASEIEPTISGLTTALSLDAAGVARLRAQLESDDPYVVIARRLTPEQSAVIRAGMGSTVATERLSGLVLEPRAMRAYPIPGGAPGTTLASQLLGFVTEDGQGHYGIEGFYDDILTGQPTLTASLHDAGGRPLPASARVMQAGHQGSDIRLTIDAGLQSQLERELYAAWVADTAKRVSAVVLDPDDGRVLAWASVPGYDASQAATVATETPELLVDPIASAVYEPGSVMKMLTASAALEAGVVGLTDEILDSYGLTFGSTTIHNSDRLAKGRIPFQDVIAFSRNVAMARVALKLGETVEQGAQRLYGTWRRYGLGERTGIDLASEGIGLVADPSEREWQPIDLADRSFGQGVAVTQIQLGVAYAAMANGGMRITPRLVAAVDETVATPRTPARVVESDLATDLRGLLEHVVTRVPWYRDGTQMPGYVVGGKTGTAQIWDNEAGQWSPDAYNFSFCGFVGTTAPEAVIVTRIEEAQPRVIRPGVVELGVTSYELFRRIADHTMISLDVAPTPVVPDVQPGDEGPDRTQDPDRDRPGRDAVPPAVPDRDAAADAARGAPDPAAGP